MGLAGSATEEAAGLPAMGCRGAPAAGLPGVEITRSIKGPPDGSSDSSGTGLPSAACVDAGLPAGAPTSSWRVATGRPAPAACPGLAAELLLGGTIAEHEDGRRRCGEVLLILATISTPRGVRGFGLYGVIATPNCMGDKDTEAPEGPRLEPPEESIVSTSMFED